VTTENRKTGDVSSPWSMGVIELSVDGRVVSTLSRFPRLPDDGPVWKWQRGLLKSQQEYITHRGTP
jgi:hypothetical protein